MVSFQEEYNNVKELENLFNKLPYRNLMIDNQLSEKTLVVPGSLLFLTELIVRNTIISSGIQLKIDIQKVEDHIVLTYKTHDKINANLRTPDFEEIQRVYAIYSEQKIKIHDHENARSISIPKLTIKP